MFWEKVEIVRIIFNAADEQYFKEVQWFSMKLNDNEEI